MKYEWENPHTEWRPAFFKALVVVAFVHVVVMFSVHISSDSDFSSAHAGEVEVIDLQPPEVDIPPPPEEIPRPATPVVGTEEVAEAVTIAETEVTAEQVVQEIETTERTQAPPPPMAEPPEEAGQTFTFTPYTEPPRCKEKCTGEDILDHIPPIFKKAGLSCELTVGIRIDTEGRVTATDVIKPSGHAACNEAAQKWAQTTQWTVAKNRDVPVVVWIAQPVTIGVQ